MSDGYVLYLKLRLETIECCKCHVVFVVDSRTRKRYLETGKSFYCPNGHAQAYSTSENEKLKRQLERERRRVESLHQEKAEADEQRRESERKYKRIRDRVKNGVCPCCNRQFQNLLEHMKSKHPDFGQQKTIKTLRLMYGLSQAALADEIGTRSAYVSRFENDKPNPEWDREVIENWLEAQAG